MDALFLSSHRADVRYDIEIGDSQRAEPVRLSVHANEQAGLMAGRAAIDHDALRKSFDTLMTRVDELLKDWEKRIQAQNKIGMLEYVVPGVQNATRNNLVKAVRDRLAAGATIEPEDMKSWFRDRAVHKGELTSADMGVSRLHEKFGIGVVRARLCELLNRQFPNHATASHLYTTNTTLPSSNQHTNRANRDYETEKSSYKLKWRELSLSNAAKLFIADPIERKQFGFEWYATQTPPFLNPLLLEKKRLSFDEKGNLLDMKVVPAFRDGDPITFVSVEKVLLPPQPSWELDHMRARLADGSLPGAGEGGKGSD